MKSVFISLNILRLYDRVLADSFPLIFTLLFGIAISKNDPKLKSFSRSVLVVKFQRTQLCLLAIYFHLSNVTCDLRGK